MVQWFTRLLSLWSNRRLNRRWAQALAPLRANNRSLPPTTDLPARLDNARDWLHALLAAALPEAGVLVLVSRQGFIGSRLVAVRYATMRDWMASAETWLAPILAAHPGSTLLIWGGETDQLAAGTIQHWRQ